MVTDQNYEKYILCSNPVRAFVESCLEQDSNGNPQKKKCISHTENFVSPTNFPLNQNSHSVEK